MRRPGDEDELHVTCCAKRLYRGDFFEFPCEPVLVTDRLFDVKQACPEPVLVDV
eukprot:COSAG06_NODE_28531_length_572_cov_1.689218_1_plen_53_part_10